MTAARIHNTYVTRRLTIAGVDVEPGGYVDVDELPDELPIGAMARPAKSVAEDPPSVPAPPASSSSSSSSRRRKAGTTTDAGAAGAADPADDEPVAGTAELEEHPAP